MTRPAAFAPQAEAELREAIRYLENAAARRGLLVAAREAASRIGINPAIGARRPALAGLRYRFWPIPPFRTVLVYTDATEPPRILRVLHTSRDLAPLLAGLRQSDM